MKQKQRIALFCMVAVALILAACDGDSGNNGVETEVDSSSSGDIFWSSSVAVSSSNAKVVWNYLNPDINYGEMTDTRDGQIYKTVVIGTQTWMAENLNYKVDSSWCYNNSADSCSKYGRLYEWASAMAVDAIYNGAILGDSINHQGACPSGWHIPRRLEWARLENAVGGWDVADTKLKSTNGWYNGDNGTNSYGFSALPAGYRFSLDGFLHAGVVVYFWSATEDGIGSAYRWLSGHDYADMYLLHYDKGEARSVRCVQDFV